MPEQTPRYFADTYVFTMHPYGCVYQFNGVTPPQGPNPAQQHPLAIVSMSLEQAKVMAILTRRALKAYEENALKGPIPLPAETIQQFELKPEEW